MVAHLNYTDTEICAKTLAPTHIQLIQSVPGKSGNAELVCTDTEATI